MRTQVNESILLRINPLYPVDVYTHRKFYCSYNTVDVYTRRTRVVCLHRNKEVQQLLRLDKLWSWASTFDVGLPRG